MHRLQKGVDLRPSAIIKWYHDRKALRNEVTLMYLSERVQSVGATDWTAQDKNGEYSLPDRYQEGVFVEAIDAS